MNFLDHKYQNKFLYICGVIIFLFLIILSVLKFYIPEKIRSLTTREELIQGCYLSVHSIDYELTRGFVLKGIILTGKDDKDLIKANVVVLNLDFLNSILNRKLIFNSVVAGSLDLSLTKKVIQLFSGEDWKNFYSSNVENQQTSEYIQVDEFKIGRLAIKYEDKYSAEFKNINASMETNADTERIRFQTSLYILNHEVVASGGVSYAGGLIVSDLDVRTGELKIPGRDKPVVPPLLIRSKTKSDFSKKYVIDITSDIYWLDKPGVKDKAGNFKLVGEYSDAGSHLELSNLNLDIKDLLKISAGGYINDINNKGETDITGKMEYLNINKLYNLVSEKYQIAFGSEVNESKFKLSGSVSDRSLNVEGYVQLQDTFFKSTQYPVEVKNANALLGFRYFLFKNSGAESYLKLDSKDAKLKVLELNPAPLNANISYRFSDAIERGLLKINSSGSDFAGGKIQLKSDIDFSKKEKPVSGELNSNGINLSSLNLQFLVATGYLENSSITFSGDFSRIDSEAEFEINNLRIDKYQISIEQLHTKTPVKLALDISVKDRKLNKLALNGQGVDIRNMDYSGISLLDTFLNIDCPDLMNREVPISLKLEGNSFNYAEYDISADTFNLSVAVKPSDSEFLDGVAGLGSAYYGKHPIGKITTGFSFKGDELEFNKIKLFFNDSYSLDIPFVKISSNDTLPFPSKIKIEDGLFISENKNKRISGIDLNLNRISSNKWNGLLSINDIRISGLSASNFKSPVKISNNKYDFENITADLNGGNFKGTVSYSKAESNPSVNASFDISDIGLSGRNNLHLGNMNIQYSGKFDGENTIPRGNGHLSFENLYFKDYMEDSDLKGSVEIVTQDETMLFQSGLINNKNASLISFTGEVKNPLESSRILSFKTKSMNLKEIKKFLNPLMPTFVRYGEIEGGMNIDISARDFPADTSLSGNIDFQNINLKGDPFSTYFNLEALNGKLEFDNSKADETGIQEVINMHVGNYENAYRESLNRLKFESKSPTLSLQALEYGFFKLENIKLYLKLIKNKLVFKILDAKLFGGKIYSSGVYDLEGGDNNSSKLYAIIRNFSLKNITDSIPGTQGYISGRFRGIISLKQRNHKTRELDGLVDLWTFKSDKEDRKIGKAFLQRLGAKERFFLGNNKSYDKGELHGYIKNGIITFSNMEISNSVLGINDLKIKVHRKRNSISVTHLLVVIRETARRVEKGTLDFEFKK